MFYVEFDDKDGNVHSAKWKSTRAMDVSLLLLLANNYMGKPDEEC